MAAVERSYEKVGNHWKPKEERGPSDPQAKKSGRDALENPAETAGGVDVEGHTKDELDVEGRSRMTKLELAQAVAKRQD